MAEGMFRVSYIMGTAAWAWVHASFMTNRNVIAMLPWPINQLDHGTESFGHALVLLLGLILLREMEMSGELEGAAIE